MGERTEATGNWVQKHYARTKRLRAEYHAFWANQEGHVAADRIVELEDVLEEALQQLGASKSLIDDRFREGRETEALVRQVQQHGYHILRRFRAKEDDNEVDT